MSPEDATKVVVKKAVKTEAKASVKEAAAKKASKDMKSPVGHQTLRTSVSKTAETKKSPRVLSEPLTPWTVTSLRLALVLIIFASTFVFFDTVSMCVSFLWHGFMDSGANAPGWVFVAALTVLVGVPALGMGIFSILILALSRETRRVSYWMTLIFFIILFFFSIVIGIVYLVVLIFFSILAVVAASATFWLIYLFFLISIGCMASIPIWCIMGLIMMIPKSTRDFYKPKEKEGRGFRL